ncbi:hypothetical protein SCYAM73S_00213 [Streptomyces cyaneofuscatus]
MAHNGADALRAAERLRPDLVLLDIYLPDMDWIDVLRSLRTAEDQDTSRPSADALFITAARDAGVIRALLRAGALPYLIKPFSRSALQEQLRHVAALRTRLDELGEARQEDVDQIFGTRPPGCCELPKGLAAPTGDLVAFTLRARPEGLSASECSDAGTLSRVSAGRCCSSVCEADRSRGGHRSQCRPCPPAVVPDSHIMVYGGWSSDPASIDCALEGRERERGPL